MVDKLFRATGIAILVGGVALVAFYLYTLLFDFAGNQ